MLHDKHGNSAIKPERGQALSPRYAVAEGRLASRETRQLAGQMVKHLDYLKAPC